MKSLGEPIPFRQRLQSPAPPGATGITLDQLAKAKRLPREFLESLGWQDQPGEHPSVRIPYFDHSGTLIRSRTRRKLNELDQPHGPRFTWAKDGTGAPMYGLHRLSGARESRCVVLVEGETDTATLWHHNLPALGFPGAGSWTRDNDEALSDALADVPRVYVVVEPDAGGIAFTKRATASRLRDRIHLIHLPGFKDISEMHIDDPDDFQDHWEQAIGTSTALGNVPDHRAFRLRSYADITATPVDWLWHRYIPRGKLTIIDGLPKTGKSTIAFDLAARVSTGAPMPNESPGSVERQPAAVLIIATEDGAADTIKPRLTLAGADMNRIFEPDLIDENGLPRDIRLPEDLAQLETTIREHGVSLVVIDPLTGILDASTNAYSDPDVRRALRPLVRLAESTGAAFLLIRHLNKATGTSALLRGGGSIAFSAIARSVLLVAGHPEGGEGRGVLARIAGNLSKKPPSLEFTLAEDGEYTSVQWGSAVAFTADDLVADPGARVTKESEAQEFLRDILADGPVSSRHLDAAATESGISKRTLDRAKEALNVKSRRAGRGWVWRLPD